MRGIRPRSVGLSSEAVARDFAHAPLRLRRMYSMEAGHVLMCAVMHHRQHAEFESCADGDAGDAFPIQVKVGQNSAKGLAHAWSRPW